VRARNGRSEEAKKNQDTAWSLTGIQRHLDGSTGLDRSGLGFSGHTTPWTRLWGGATLTGQSTDYEAAIGWEVCIHPRKRVPSSFPCSSLAPLLRLQWERYLESRQLADINQHMYIEAVNIASDTASLRLVYLT
jgi:hypothetical protein